MVGDDDSDDDSDDEGDLLGSVKTAASVVVVFRRRLCPVLCVRERPKNGNGCLSLRFSPNNKRRALVSSAISSSSESSEGREEDEDRKYDFIQEISDENLLTTSLNRAITDEDYELAAKLSKRLQVVQKLERRDGDAREILLDWRMLGGRGVDGGESRGARVFGFQLGFRGKRRRRFLDGDRLIVISAQTGDREDVGRIWFRTMDQMDFVGREMLQILVVVPTRELVVQTTMLAYKLTGGSIFERRAWRSRGNMFNYSGPQGLIVKGVFRAKGTC